MRQTLGLSLGSLSYNKEEKKPVNPGFQRLWPCFAQCTGLGWGLAISACAAFQREIQVYEETDRCTNLWALQVAGYSQSIRPLAWSREARLEGKQFPDQACLSMPCCRVQTSASSRAVKRAGLPLVPNTPPSGSVETQAIILALLSCQISHKQSMHSAQGSKKEWAASPCIPNSCLEPSRINQHREWESRAHGWAQTVLSTSFSFSFLFLF